MSKASEKAKKTKHERECLRREALERKQVLAALKKGRELSVLALQHGPAGSRLPFWVRPLKKGEPNADSQVLYTYEGRLHVVLYRHLLTKDTHNVHGVVVEHFMVDCEECMGSGQVEQSCVACGVTLTSDNIHENSEHEACKKCGDEAEAEWDESNDR